MTTKKQDTSPATTGPEMKPITPFKEKLLHIMESIHILEKDGKNDFHKYKYTTEKTVKLALREAFLRERVLIQFEAQDSRATVFKGEKGDNILTDITGAIILLDVDSDQALKIPFMGSGSDKGDKGLYKAITGMIKYALTSTFLIATGDDPEKDMEKYQPELAQNVRETIDAIITIEELRTYYEANKSKNLGPKFDAYVVARKKLLSSPQE